MRTRLLIALPILLVLVVGVSAAAEPDDVPAPANPGFEEGGAATGSPAGWQSAGDRGADFTEAGGHSGGFRLTPLERRSAYEVETTPAGTAASQDGWYTLRAWVRSSAGDERELDRARDCGGARTRAFRSRSRPRTGCRSSSRRSVERGTCTIVLRTEAAGGEWTNFDDVELVPGAARLSILGADVSSLAKSEDKGGVYRTASGRRGDALDDPRGRRA